MEEKPLTRKDHQFVDWFRKYRDIYKAAERAGIAKNQAKKTYDRIEIFEEIERQDAAVTKERAHVQVAAEQLNNELLERVHIKLLSLDPEKHAEVIRRSMMDGYVLTGRIEAGNTRSLEAKEGPDAKPNFYQAFVPMGVPVNISPILPEEHKDHHFPIALPPAKNPVATKPAERAITAAAPSGPLPKAGRIKFG